MTARDYILEAVETLRKFPRVGPLTVYTVSLGFPDELVIELFKDTNFIVVDRNGKEWQYGEPLR